MLSHLFETLGRQAAWAATDPPNLASIRVMERLGGRQDGDFTFHFLYSELRK